jgi:hypothetical protein
MSEDFARGLHEVAADVARVHLSGPGLPVARIDARSRRVRRRHEVSVAVASGAVVVAVVLGGAALLDRPGAVPPAVTPSESPSSSPSPTPAPSLSPDVEPPPQEALLGAGDLDRLILDPSALAAVLPGVGDLAQVDEPLGDWGLDPDAVVFPSEECRAATTVVLEQPTAFRRVGWGSMTAMVRQELVVLTDADAATAAFAALGAALEACPEYGASLPGSSGATYEVADVAAGTTGLPSFRVAGTESGEGQRNAWLQVDVLVRNVIVRTAVYLYGGPETASAADASAVGDLLEETIQSALLASSSP